jgi:hypothetical protein
VPETFWHKTIVTDSLETGRDRHDIHTGPAGRMLRSGGVTGVLENGHLE